MKIIKKLYIFILIAVVILLVSCQNNTPKLELVHSFGQTGVVSSVSDVTLENQPLILYKTTNKSVDLYFETQYLDEGYQNLIFINDTHPIQLMRGGAYEVFSQSTYNLVSPNIIDGKLTLTFKSGTNALGTYDNFFLRNVHVKIDDEVIWSKEFPQDDFLNESLRLGNDDLQSEFRHNYYQSITTTFDIPEKYLNSYGSILENNTENYNFKVKDKSYELTNVAYLDYDINIEDGAFIDETTTIEVTSNEHTQLDLYLDGIPIENGFKITKGASSIGDHKLDVVVYNAHGFKTIEEINFTVEEAELTSHEHNYRAYNYGMVENINMNFESGKLVDFDEDTPFLSPFSEYGLIGIEIDYDVTKLQFNYVGSSLSNRSNYLQIYNAAENTWQTVSTYLSVAEEMFNLGYDFSQNSENYMINDKVRFKVISVNLENLSLVSDYLYHVTDIQYITQKIAQAEGSVIGNTAAHALTTMQEYITAQTQAGKHIYTMMTGDFTQTLNNAENEYEKVMEYFFTPLLDEQIKFGVLSGNHDVGGVSQNIHGADALDEYLRYEYWNANLGENVFSHYDFYQSSYDNNRSHHDRLEINGQMFSFLYLGWGSSTKGINISIKDINYAKGVLENFPNDIFVLLAHNFMGNNGSRSSTGNYVYGLLVEPYPQIKIVVSGHINGSSSRVDYLDDDKDGLKDRRVFQFLTNFQEEDTLYGASFIRRMGLDFVNNRFVMDLYSPFYNSSDIYVANRHSMVNQHKLFKYDFDFSGNGYALKTYRIQ